MRVLTDTNILTRLAQRQHAQHSAAMQACDALLKRQIALCVVPQVLYEFWVVATRPLENNRFALTAAETDLQIAKTLETFDLLLDERAIYPRWRALVSKFEVRGKNAHDARLVAAVQRHSIDTILTFNAADFRRFTSLTVLDPANLTIPSA